MPQSDPRKALQSAIEALQSSSAHRATPRVTVLRFDLDEIDVELRFLSGKTYCCAEPGCHLPARSRAWWQRLRQVLRAAKLNPPSLAIRIRGTVKNGTLLEVFGTKQPRASIAYEYADGPHCENEAT